MQTNFDNEIDLHFPSTYADRETAGMDGQGETEPSPNARGETIVAIGAIGSVGAVEIGSTMGISAAAQVLVQLASASALPASAAAVDTAGIKPSALVTISQLAQDQAAQDSLFGQGSEFDVSFGELAQALIVALMLQLLQNRSPA